MIQEKSHHDYYSHIQTIFMGNSHRNMCKVIILNNEGSCNDLFYFFLSSMVLIDWLPEYKSCFMRSPYLLYLMWTLSLLDIRVDIDRRDGGNSLLLLHFRRRDNFGSS